MMMDKLKYIMNPNMPKMISVEVSRLKPLPSSRETNGANIKARRIDSASIIRISVSK
jgi:hypothetical protein